MSHYRYNPIALLPVNGVVHTVFRFDGEPARLGGRVIAWALCEVRDARGDVTRNQICGMTQEAGEIEAAEENGELFVCYAFDGATADEAVRERRGPPSSPRISVQGGK